MVIGTPKWDRQIKKDNSFTLDINTFLVLNDRYLILFADETWGLQNSIHQKKNEPEKTVNPMILTVFRIFSKN